MEFLSKIAIIPHQCRFSDQLWSLCFLENDGTFARTVHMKQHSGHAEYQLPLARLAQGEKQCHRPVTEGNCNMSLYLQNFLLILFLSWSY